MFVVILMKLYVFMMDTENDNDFDDVVPVINRYKAADPLEMWPKA